MTLPKLPTTSSQISEANKNRKNGQLSTSDWLLQDSKSKFSTSSMSPLSSGMNSMENSFPKMSIESSSSNFSEVISIFHANCLLMVTFIGILFSQEKCLPQIYQCLLQTYWPDQPREDTVSIKPCQTNEVRAAIYTEALEAVEACAREREDGLGLWQSLVRNRSKIS